MDNKMILQDLENKKKSYFFSHNYDLIYDADSTKPQNNGIEEILIRVKTYYKNSETKEKSSTIVWTYLYAGTKFTFNNENIIETHENLAHIALNGKFMYKNPMLQINAKDNDEIELLINNNKISIQAGAGIEIKGVSENTDPDFDSLDYDNGSWWRGGWHSDNDW